MRSFPHPRRDGFTLIELLIVVAIIGILAAIAVPNFTNARVKALVSRSRADIKAIGDAIKMYHLDHGSVWKWEDGNPYKELMRLTTPVAYMANVPDDVFFPEVNDSPSRHYDYHSYGPIVPNKDWALWGCGPDRGRNTNCFFYTPETFGQFTDQLYNPSNGLITTGDIINNSWYGLSF
ncbi:MAG TPA: prepilin-type N-terminal cleavage/methylation domain-containing protein [bacterium]|nr:prepilin-type N-terminal cleavage/methylation domain-containing protein [bacterium]HQP98024.1 prepilin-type N-terminal cleavage/methylation domain-containing protein [bacterium]